MRKAHILKRTFGRDRPQNVVFFDVETDPTDIGNNEKRHLLKLGAASYCRTSTNEYLAKQRSISFTTADEFWTFLESTLRSKAKTYLIAHNIVFDLTVLDGFSQLERRGWVLQSWYSKGFTSIFRWRKGDLTLIGLDNGNFFTGKLEKWGEIVGYPKQVIDFETVTDKDLLSYCQTDVQIMVLLWRLWLVFLDEHRCGSFKPTVASTAFNIWRHRFMRHKVYIHNNKEALALERQSYRGGRVECFYIGLSDHTQYHYLDVNNMYGYVLREHEYPSTLLGYKETDSIYSLRRKLAKYAVVAKVTVNITNPLFPYKLKGHTCYPVGRFITTLTTPELKLALDNDWIEALHSLSWYIQKPLFDEFVDYFYSLRKQYVKEDNKPFATICKLLINSFYGKFGQRGFNQKTIGEVGVTSIWRETVLLQETGEIYDLVALAGRVFKEWKEGESYHSFPVIAAHVTAYARLYLFDLKQSVPEREAYYMDTDSLIVSDKGLKALQPRLDKERLGQLKVERSSPYLRINAPKDYEMKGRIKRKGISSNAVEVEPGVFEQEQWVRLAGMIRRGNTSEYITTTVRKHLRREFHQATVRRSGWCDPFRLDLDPGSEDAPLMLPPVERLQSAPPSRSASEVVTADQEE